MSARHARTPLIFILLTAFALRLYRLGVASLWYDETVSAVLARKSITNLIAHTGRDIHPPGYYLLLHLWVHLAGQTEFALAFFSLIFSILLIALVYHAGRTFFSPNVGLWAAALIALSPYNLWYAQEVRMYTLGAFLGLLAVLFGLRASGEGCLRRDNAMTGTVNVLAKMKSPTKDPLRLLITNSYWFAYTLTAALGLYTLYYFAFLLVPLNLYLVARLLLPVPRPISQVGAQQTATRPTFKLAVTRPPLRNWLLANLGILLLYLPWLGVAWRQVTNPPVPPWRSAIDPRAVIVESWSALSLGESVQPGQVWPLLLLSAGLFGLGLLAARSWRWRILLFLLVCGPLAIIVLLPMTGLTGPLYHVRYLFTYSPLFYLVLGLGLTRLGQWWRWWPTLAVLPLLGGMVFSTIEYHTDPRYAGDDLRGAVQFIQQHWRPGDVILVNAGYTYTALQYYYDGPLGQLQRLTDFDPQTLDPTAPRPTVLQTGSVDGPLSLGWGDSAADFYTMSHQETLAALERVTETYPRLWQFRLYDTVTDPQGLIRAWLAAKTIPFADQVFPGPATLRVQGFMSPHPPPPPQPTELTLGQRFRLLGFTPPPAQAQPGQTINVALWLAAQDNPGDVPFALSLKLWDDQGTLVTQTEPDEWPAGNLFFTPAWPAGQPVYYPMRLALPADTPPGHYWLNAVFYNSQDGTPLTVLETGEPVVLLGGVVVGAE